MSVILGDYNKKKTSNISIDGYVQSLPPENDIPPSWSANECRIFSCKKESGEITEWKNEEGNTTHYTEKKIDKKGNKFLIPFTYWTKTTEEGKLVGIWKPKGWLGKKCFHKSNLIPKCDLPLLVVEGEKCMHFAERDPFLSKHYLATTWYGGVENIDDFNFDIFKDKEVILCPDNDEPGRKAMHTIAHHLVTNGITENIKYFNLAERFGEHFPSAWDIADDFPKKYELETVLGPNSMCMAHYKDVKDDKLWKEIEVEERKRIEKETAGKISKSLCYVMANDMFNKIGSADFYQKQQLNNFHKHQIKKASLTDLLLKDPNFARAETFMTSAKFKPGLVNITKPGIIPLIQKGIVLNIYVPNYLTEKKGDVKFLIQFFIWLVGLEKWKIIEQWIAYMLQYPGEKIKWSIVLVSAVEGVGKGLLARILSRVLGFENVNENANYKHLINTHNTLLVGTQALVLNEVSLGDFKSKTEGTNTLKNFVADDFYSCNFKNKPMVKLPNLTNIMLFSNDLRVIGANQGVRRYFFCNIIKTEQEIIQKTNEGFFDKAWNFVDSDEGASALIHYFNREVNIPKPKIFKARAPVTDDLELLIEQSKHPLQKKLEHDLTRPDINKRKIFGGSWCGLITFDELNERLNTTAENFDRSKFSWGSFGDDAIYKFLSANSTRWNNGEPTRQISIQGVKHRFHLLDDTRCPVPNKSYKDLAPKQIETIHQNYTQVIRDIKNEEPEHKRAKEYLPDQIKIFKDTIRFWIDLAEGKKKSKWKTEKGPGKILKSKTVDQAYNEIMDGTIELFGEDAVERNKIKLMEFKLQRGIRTPEQIIADIPKGDPDHQIKYNGSFTPKEAAPEEEPSQPETKSALYQPKPITPF